MGEEFCPVPHTATFTRFLVYSKTTKKWYSAPLKKNKGWVESIYVKKFNVEEEEVWVDS